MRRSVAVLFLLPLAACESATGPEPTPVQIDAPAEVAAGVEFTIRVTTSGYRCAVPEGADVRRFGLAARVTPRDADHGHACVAVVRTLPREVPLRFDRPGLAVVSVREREMDGSRVATEPEQVIIRIR